MDETATRSDVASTKVGDMFTTDPFYFDAVRANSKLEKCITCAECEDLCDALEDILDTLHKPDNNTPERLRVINEVQWIALKCSRKSPKLQCQEFKDYITEIERLNSVKVPTATVASKTAKSSTAITPIEKAEVIADSLQEQFEPNHVADREVFDQRIHEEVANFLATPHVQEIEPTTPTEVLTYVQRIKPKNPRT
ncbi:hypothetical protein TNCV_2316531 [Trichonephila clavipes]|nr:hypothetical protein TNCV_2316531 [Trichonephila clavipes]